MLLQSDLAGERSQFATENKTASERTFVRFFSTKHGSLRITVGRWLPKETPIRSAPRLGGIYLIPITRRDIAYAVHVVSQFVSASTGPRRGVRRHSLGNSAEDHTGHRFSLARIERQKDSFESPQSPDGCPPSPCFTSVYSGKVMLFRFRDSLNLLPGTLQNLAMSLCPDLGTKGSVDHESVNEKSLEKDKEVLIEYMKTDILLLGGVMQKAQNIYWKLYQLDIESKITLSSLALNIFRLRYYNDEIFPIHIPNQNEDTFIRKAYYGDYISRKVISSLSDRVLHLENERLNEKLEERNREIAKLKSQIEVQTGVTNQTLVEKKTDMKTKTDEEKQKTDEEKPNTDACCALALLWAFIEVSSKQDHFEDFLCDGSLHGCHESIGIDYGIFSTLSAIAAEMGQLQNDIQGQQRALNYLLRSVRTLDPPMREARIHAAREQLESLERRQQALRAEHQALIVQAVIHGHRGD
ncbi:hypothetical protein L6452_36115 [Arctium lappa]|uniref:Uncharacterized protein n=1 Tax=Arctium lappa TaxID=4217 RepID=A0ACB8Y9D7_ARCLA|nr:hypothetical protein L6452_36115 [Arctium lappa]